MSNNEISTLYPPPPPYYKFFTPENIARYKKLKEENKSDDEISEIPDVKFLVKPKQPQKEQYSSFGELWWFKDKIVGLKESGIEQIYPESEPITQSNDEDEVEEVFTQARIDELKKMAKSLLLNYLQLIGLLVKNPSLAQNKINDIRTILINVHHLLNSYRSHQSRESLILTMQNKLNQTQKEIDTIKSTFNDVKEKLDNLVDNLQKNKIKPDSLDEEEIIQANIDPKDKSYTISKEVKKAALDDLMLQFNQV